MSGREFYGRWARLYDTVARRTPGVAGLRRRSVAALELDRGDTVVEFGCGTGANLPLLAEAVGPTGTVVGVDYARPALERARRLVGDHPAVTLCHADATTPPFSGPVDGVLGTFVIGMFEEPAAIADRWWELLGPGGNCVLLSATRADGMGRVLNPAFRAAVVLSTPPTGKLRYERDLVTTLDDRVRTGHDRILERAEATVDERRGLGVIRLTGGRRSQ